MAHTYLYGGRAAQIVSPYCSQICLKCDSSHVALLCDIFSWFPLLQDEVQILSRGSQALRNLTLTASQQCLQAIKVYSVVSVKLLSSHWHPCLCSCHSFSWTKHSPPRFSSVQSLSRVRLFVTPWTTAHQASLSITNSRSLLKLMSISLVILQPPHPLLSPSPHAFNLSQHQGLFLWVSSLHQVAKVLEFQHQSFQWISRTDLL